LEFSSAHFSQSYFFFRSYSPSHYRQVTRRVQIIHQNMKLSSRYDNRGSLT
jgi:hypothetical protein